MNASEIKWAVRLGLLALTVSSSAFSQSVEEERIAPIADQTQRHSEVSLSFQHLSDPARRRGMYTGTTEERTYLSADVEVQRFDPVTGTLLRLSGRDLGLDQREARFDYSRQGQWRYLLGFSQTTRFEPFVVNTGITGIGTANVVVNGAAPRNPVDYKMARHLFTGGADYAIDKALSLRVRFTHETKDGERIYGRGTFGNTTVEHLPEPIDRTTETIEVALSYTAKDLQLTGGYYGTLFANHANGLFVTGGAAGLNANTAANPTFSPMSQPLDNNSHQLFLTGGYNVTPLTRAMFKASQTVAQQNENLLPANAVPGPLPGAPASLKGRVDTTIAFLDLTSFEVDRLDLQASVRFEDRNDKTPEAQYLSLQNPNSQGTTLAPLPGTAAGQTGFNKPRSWRSLRTKAEAGYELPAHYKVLASWELDNQQRNAPEPFRRVSYRTETDESTMLLAVKRSMIDSVQGSLSYGQARRTGSAYLPSTYDRDGSGTATSNPSIQPTSLVNPLIWADRDRHTWKATIEWAPLDELLVNLLHERSSDYYSGRDLGPRDGGRVYTALDASYKLSDRWNAHVWWSLDDIRANQAQQVNPTNPPVGPLRGQLWQAALRQLSEGMGVGVQGRTRSGIEAGVDLAFSDQSAEQRMGAMPGALPSDPVIPSLPDYYYRMLELRAHGVYPLDKQSGLRADYSFQDWRTNDWTWTGWQYADGTTIFEENRQRSHFIGASYYYRWR